MRTSFLLPLLVLITGCASSLKTNTPKINKVDKNRLILFMQASEKFGESVWPNWQDAPRSLILVNDEYEFLIWHENPTTDFKLSEDHHDLGPIYFRKRTFGKNYLAAFPAIDSTPTIVVGTAVNTQAKTGADWIATLTHEHFHQLQYTQKGYYKQAAELDLNHGQIGSDWMLNYPFPYYDQEVVAHFKHMGQALHRAIHTGSQHDLQIYLTMKNHLKTIVSENDYKYFLFQLWQEGIARYTENQFLIILRKHYDTKSTLSGISSNKDFSSAHAHLLKRTFAALQDPEIDKYQRLAFYAFGAGEAMILDKIQPNWKTHYFKQLFNTDLFFY